MNQLNKHKRIKFVNKWLPVLLWATVIFLFSTEHFAAPQSSRILGPLLHWLFPGITPEQVSSVQFVVRKLGHCFEYFVLAVLLYRALYPESGGRSSVHPAAMTMGLAVIWAITDEFHQSLVPSRTASIVDVMIDGFGALCGTFWMYLRHR
ncbi:MAG TPA: VanZ family protein [Candidatus Polarisedimenticolaceae bacterium]|nr:VanZ family protein [Candidatus Polarisedimenticolaceae bacterium]